MEAFDYSLEGDPTLISMGDKAHSLVVLSIPLEGDVTGVLGVRDGTTIPHMVLETMAERLAATHAGSFADA